MSRMPSSCARRFMRSTKTSSVPHRCSAKATAQSLAETTAIVEVVDIDYFEEDEVPMPLEKVKVVIEKVDEFGVYPEDEE